MNYEDDRIRSKNRVHNEAYNLYESLHALGYSHYKIIDYANFAKLSVTSSHMIEVYDSLISLINKFQTSKVTI